MRTHSTKVRLAVLCMTIMGQAAYASSHREAPSIAGQPLGDATDFYMFNSYENSRQDYVTLIANYVPLQDAFGGPNYFALDSRAAYEIHIDNDGDAKEDITFRFQFNNELANSGEGIALPIGDKTVGVPLKNIGPISANSQDNLNFKETYKISLIRDGRRNRDKKYAITQLQNASNVFDKPYDYVGNKTFTSADMYENYAKKFIYDVTIPECNQPGRVFVGQRKDSFTVNLGETFDLVNYIPVEADSSPGAGDGAGFPGGISQSDSNDDLINKNITTIALEVPKECLIGQGNGVIGAWTTASLRQVSIRNPRASFHYPEVEGGAWTQVSRLGNPLVNEVVIGLAAKDRFNSSYPKNDLQFADFVTHPTLPTLLNVLFKDAVNNALNLGPANAITNLAPSNYPRNDLVAAFLTGFSGVNQLKEVTPSEILRLNTSIPAVAVTDQSRFGVIGDDLAGFPNGRRPGDDVVDIALRVVMGRLCHPIPVSGVDTNLGLCQPSDAVVGTVPFTDGAPINAGYFTDQFPYLNTPVPGSPN